MLNKERRFLEFRETISNNSLYIIHEVQKSWEVINFHHREPDVVYNYLRYGVKYLNEKVAAKLSVSGFIIKFAGVFVHQKPIVTPVESSSYNKNCELGDLLTVFIMLDRNKNVLHQRAFISQVKKENKLDNKCQQFLYERSSGFSYFRGACKYNREL